jgi:hypothetical protein
MFSRFSIVLLCVLGSGCASLKPAWEVFTGKSADEVWGAAQDVVSGEFDLDKLDAEQRRLETAWREELAPFSREGRRVRVVAWVEWDSHRGAPLLCVEVEKETNTNVDRPLSRAQASWSPDGREARLERHILDKVKLALMEIGPSREIREGRPSRYRRDPRDAGREALWGDGEPAGGEKDPDLWERREEGK